MKRLWSRERRNPDIHRGTGKNWKSIVYLRSLCPLAHAKWGMIPKLSLSCMKGKGLAMRGPGDLLFPRSAVKYFWARNLMTGRLAVAIGLGIGKNIPDTKTGFPRSLLQKQGFTARRLLMGGSVGKGSAESGSTGPGLLPSQRVRSSSTSMTQVIEDVVARPGIVYTYKLMSLVRISSNLFLWNKPGAKFHITCLLNLK